MTDFNQEINEAKDLLNLDQKDISKLPQMLNVLTILTYIGCGLGLLSAVYTYFTIGTSYKAMEVVNSSPNSVGGDNNMVKNVLNSSLEMIKKQYENRHLIFLLSIVGIALCFYGAMQMRNLKKQGFMIYLIGELIPILSFAIFIGFGSLLSGASMIFATLFAAVFIILYATQRKFLVN